MNDKVGDEQAKAKIDEIKARLAKGEDFAALAKEFSQDIGSAATGGDLATPVAACTTPRSRRRCMR
ncbi:hypothetical protein BH77_07430 [Pseudomonas aeruginosa C2773C]|nr:hypothetical protein BH77_07430 [Pseudomonas aeruginosa C2773C]